MRMTVVLGLYLVLAVSAIFTMGITVVPMAQGVEKRMVIYPLPLRDDYAPGDYVRDLCRMYHVCDPNAPLR
jgi:hypothetical protein